MRLRSVEPERGEPIKKTSRSCMRDGHSGKNGDLAPQLLRDKHNRWRADRAKPQSARESCGPGRGFRPLASRLRREARRRGDVRARLRAARLSEGRPRRPGVAGFGSADSVQSVESMGRKIRAALRCTLRRYSDHEIAHVAQPAGRASMHFDSVELQWDSNAPLGLKAGER